MTGIASGGIFKLDLKETAELVKKENERIAKIIGVNKAARCTTVKPEGTASMVVGSSSGIHAWHNDYYFRRMRIGKNEPLYNYLAVVHPELVENDFFKPNTEAIICVPQKAPDGAITRQEEALDLLARVSHIYLNWIKPGHRSGHNVNNCSTTVTVKDHEWKDVGEWMWDNRDNYTALAILPYDNHTYTQAPFEDITKEQFEKAVKHLTNIDLTQVKEVGFNNNLQESLACSGNVCEIVQVA